LKGYWFGCPPNASCKFRGARLLPGGRSGLGVQKLASQSLPHAKGQKSGRTPPAKMREGGIKIPGQREKFYATGDDLSPGQIDRRKRVRGIEGSREPRKDRGGMILREADLAQRELPGETWESKKKEWGGKMDNPLERKKQRASTKPRPQPRKSGRGKL